MASQYYVSVARDDWYERRRQDAEGEFFRNVADQGPRKGRGGDTRQGIYCLTADGKLLVYRNAGQNPAAMREALQYGLAEWRKLPPSERRPGALKIEAPQGTDRAYSRKPPPGGLIVNVYTRALEKGPQDELCKCSNRSGIGIAAARDHLWLTAVEAKSLMPDQPKVGDAFPMPARITERVLRFHLVDNTRGEPPHWRREEIRRAALTLSVDAVTTAWVRLRVEGSALLSTKAAPQTAERGYEVELTGKIEYNPERKIIERFDMLALGDHWGEGPFTRRARPGRTPLGIVFELTNGESPADQVPPQAARELRQYFGN